MIVSLTLVTKLDDDGNLGFSRLSDMAIDLQDQYAQVTVHSIDNSLEDEVEEFFDEGTLKKVLESILTYVEQESDANDIINEMQNRGILFREIKK